MAIQTAAKPAGSWHNGGMIERRILELRGPDVERFLQNVSTQDVRGRTAWTTAFCDRTGRMQAVARVLKFPDRFVLSTEAANLHAHLSKYIIMDRVEVVEAGVSSVTASWPADLAPGEHRTVAGGWLARWDQWDEPEYEVFGTAVGAPPADLEARRIARGFPRWGVDMGPEHLPMEAGLTALAVSYDKGCYVGQEVILRVRNFGKLPQELRLLEFAEGGPPAPGTPVDEGGAVTSAHGRLALGYVKKSHVAPGSVVTVAGRKAMVRIPPFQEPPKTTRSHTT